MLKNNPVLFVGNGINNISNQKSWVNVLNKIIENKNIEIEVNDDTKKLKPFPLLYEEIFLTAARKKVFSERELKEDIAKDILNSNDGIKPNAIHTKIMGMKIAHILTTNYDYALQYSIDQRPAYEVINSGHIKETTFSIFRTNDNIGSHIWHIHGECNYPNSITLGYEHYCGQIQRMRNYVVTGTTYNYKNLMPFKDRLKTNDLNKIYSWVDLFFLNDIHIIGLTLDTSEIDLWWLLTYRARMMLKKSGVKIKNNIFYYYPKKFIDPAKNQLLIANRVTPIEINMSHNGKYYDHILDHYFL